MGIGKKTNQPEGDSQNNRSIGIDPDDLQAATSSVKPQEDMTKWLDDKAWKQPKWLKRTNADKPKNQGFQNFYLNSLRARYLRLEGDFRTAYSNFYNSPYMDLVTSRLIINYLQNSREALEDDDCDVNDVITMLDLADQSLVWIYPPHYAKAQAFGMAAELRGEGNPWGRYLENEALRRGQTLGGLRAALDKTKQAINEAKQASAISTGLQIERLNTARKWSWYVLIASLVFLPLVVKSDTNLWNDTIIGKFIVELRPWMAILCAAIFGAGGAFLSSLMNVQKTRTVLTDYQENLKNNQLKLNVGALAAIIIFIFLTWDIIPGVTMKNAGSLIFLAFIAGFSERYFLNLLNINNDDIALKPAPITLDSTPPMDASMDKHPMDMTKETNPTDIPPSDEPQNMPKVEMNDVPKENDSSTFNKGDVNSRTIN